MAERRETSSSNRLIVCQIRVSISENGTKCVADLSSGHLGWAPAKPSLASQWGGGRKPGGASMRAESFTVGWYVSCRPSAGGVQIPGSPT